MIPPHLNPDLENKLSPEEIERLREMPAWRKLQLAAEMRHAVIQQIRDEIRETHQTDDARLIRRLLANRLLGEELALRVYGKIEDIEEQAR